MNKKIVILAVVGLLFATAGMIAQAKVTSTKPNIKAQVAATKNTSSTNATSTKCQRVTEKIGTKVNNFENGQLRRVSAYQNMKTRLSNVIAKLTEKGVDTSDLRADLVILETKIQKLTQDYTPYLSRVKETKNYACGSSDTQFRGRLSESRRLMAQVKTDVQDIKSFYSSTIKPDLLKARAELKALKSTSTPPVASTTPPTASSTL